MQHSVARCLICPVLSLALALLGLYGALACHEIRPAIAMVICGGEGPQTLCPGQDGNQVSDRGDPSCADGPACHGLRDLAVPEPPLAPPAVAVLSHRVRPATQGPGAPQVRFHAAAPRGPPIPA